MSDPIRVFLVDDHDLFRAGVRAEIGSHVELVGEADEVAADRKSTRLNSSHRT